MVDSKHQWKAWVYLLPAIILLLIFTVWPIFNTVTTAFIYKEEYKPPIIKAEGRSLIKTLLCCSFEYLCYNEAGDLFCEKLFSFL